MSFPRTVVVAILVVASAGACSLDGNAIFTEPRDGSFPRDTSTSADSARADSAPPVDSGRLDSGRLDSSVMDSGPADTGPADTGPADTGPADTGMPDAGAPDTAMPDTSVPPPTCDAQYSSAVRGYHLCDELVDSCEFYTNPRPAESCDTTCGRGGGRCLAAWRESGLCGHNESRRCNFPMDDMICICSRGP